jgi:hypothetical protein
MEEKGLTAEALNPLQYPASADSDPIPVDPYAKEPPIEADLEDSDEDGEEDQPGKKVWVTMTVDEDYKDEASTFSYMGLQVPIKTLFNQIKGFTLYPRKGVNFPHTTSVDKIPPNIRSISP